MLLKYSTDQFKFDSSFLTFDFRKRYNPFNFFSSFPFLCEQNFPEFCRSQIKDKMIKYLFVLENNLFFSVLTKFPKIFERI